MPWNHRNFLLFLILYKVVYYILNLKVHKTNNYCCSRLWVQGATHLCVLLQQHLVQDGHQPVFKFTVVIVGHHQITNSTASEDRGRRTRTKSIHQQVCLCEPRSQISTCLSNPCTNTTCAICDESIENKKLVHDYEVKHCVLG